MPRAPRNCDEKSSGKRAANNSYIGDIAIMAHVCFINSCPDRNTIGLNSGSLWPPLGLASMAAFLGSKGYTATIIDAWLELLDNDIILQRIPEGSDYIGINIDSFKFNVVQDLCKKIKHQKQDIFIILGGPFAHVSPDLLLKEFACDCVVQGEGEYALHEIIKARKTGITDFYDAPGVWWKGDDGIVRNTPQKRIMDLDSLPFPAYHLLPPLEKYKSFSRQMPVAPLITSRGCAFSCSFCSRGCFRGQVVFRSAQHVLGEIDLLVTKYGIRQLDILDDNFILHKERMEQIFDGIISRNYKLSINFNSGIRSEGLTKEHFVKMKQAGAIKVSFGIESADENVLKLCNKKLNLSTIEKAVEYARSAGIIVCGFFIIGLPGENEEAFQKTLQFARKLQLDIANFCIAIPFPGTGLYKQISENGKFVSDTDRDLTHGFYGNKVFCLYGDQHEEEILRRYKMAYREFYSLGTLLRLFLKLRSFNEWAWVLKSGMSVIVNYVRGIFK